MYNVEEVYPNSPLIEVICELRFKRNLRIESQRHDFYEKIIEKYVHILVPNFSSTTPVSLIPYKFENEIRDAGVRLAIDKFSYYNKKYVGHKEFMKEFMRLFDIFSKTYSIDSPTRLGWRYINVIPFTRESGLIPLSDFFDLKCSFSESQMTNFENLDIVFVTKVENGSITIKLQTAMDSKSQQEVFVFDIDFAKTEKLSLKSIENNMQQAQNQARLLFENSITDKYRDYLRGEKI
ncbi:TIGR04255 family protein [candidate division KSB1 bacterium]|nr:TIGR04255 family protein [candidate division KSB1 bacterium]TDI87379.1 MAG: TIGR04255 family protein [Caldithrix sp.]TDI94745.1 MAG: TIGR04255 family protein [Caldithrix sp.]